MNSKILSGFNAAIRDCPSFSMTAKSDDRGDMGQKAWELGYLQYNLTFRLIGDCADES